MNQRGDKRTKSEILDVEFKKILCIIREYIPYINSNAYLMQCRVWLEKLSNPHVNKILRNLYLIELCGQIQKDKLLPPFNEAPPSGSLKSLTKILMNRKSCKFLFQDLRRKKSKLSNQNSSTSDTKDKDSVNDLSAETTLLSASNTQTWASENSLKLDTEVGSMSELIKKKKYGRQIPIRRSKKSNAKFDIQHIDQLQSKALDCGEPTTSVINEAEDQTYLMKELTESVSKKEGDSWSDLTDASVTSSLQILTTNEKETDETISYLQNKIKPDTNKTEPFNDSESEAQDIKCYDVEELNFKNIKDTNYISEDWKNTIDALQIRLSETTQQNNELKAMIQKLEVQTDDIRYKHKEEIEQIIKKLENLQSEENAKLKDIYAGNIVQLENSFRSNIEKLERDYTEKIHKVTDCYEEKISELSNQSNEVTRRKDGEICRLAEIIEKQCARITNDISALQNQVAGCSCDKKLILLKKCVSKMDKLFQRSEREHLRQIDRLRQELEIKDTALQIHLKIQKAELIAEASSERQEEFDKILNSLEIKYIKMLELHESQIMGIKKQDDEKIQHLKELLSKHGIQYDEHDL